MPQCTHCGHEFAVSEGFRCPSCGDDWRGPATQASDGPSGGAPAHLAVLGGAAPAEREPKKRIVSTAGPSVPVLQKQDDSVPSGWMARLEAARMVARGDSGVTEAANPSAQPVVPATAPAPPSAPPPLKAALQKKQASAKPAHLLVAQLEADESRRQTQGQASDVFAEEAPKETISNVQVDLPEALKKKRRLPDWVVMAVLGVLVLGGIGYAYTNAQKEPAPEAKIDPELAKKAALRKKAIAALEQGHSLALEGKGSADKAIAAYQEALRLEPTLASAERGLAIVYASKDDDAAAVSHYRRYLSLSPEARDAPQVRAIISRWEKTQGGKRP